MYLSTDHQCSKVSTISFGSIGSATWDVIVNFPFIPKHVVGDELFEQPWSDKFEVENKKVQYDCMVKKYHNFYFES